MKKILTLLTVFCALVGIVACSSSPASPSGVVEKYAKALKSGNYDAIVELMHFEGGSDEEVEQGKAMVSSVLNDKAKPEDEKKGGVASYVIGEETISEDGLSATVEIALTYGDGTSKEDKMKVENVDGVWYLDAGK